MNFWVEPFAKRLSISGRNASGPNLSGDVAAYVGTTVDFVGQTGQPWVLLLGKSTEKQRLGYGSEHMIPAADAYRVDASNSQQRPPWGCPEAAGLPRLAGGSGVSMPKSAPDHEIAGAVASSSLSQSPERPLYLVLQPLLPDIWAAAPGRSATVDSTLGPRCSRRAVIDPERTPSLPGRLADSYQEVASRVEVPNPTTNTGGLILVSLVASNELQLLFPELPGPRSRWPILPPSSACPVSAHRFFCPSDTSV